MSKKLNRALVEGRVEVLNNTAGEVMVRIPERDGTIRTLCLPPRSRMELAPKFTDAMLLTRSPNLGRLLSTGKLKIV